MTRADAAGCDAPTVRGICEAPSTYWLDAEAGSDHWAGTSAQSPWRTLRPLNGRELRPGDRVLLRAGTVYHGPLRLTGSGRADLPILVGAYGDGPRPAIHGHGVTDAAVHLHNVRHFVLDGLEVTHHGATRRPHRRGVLVDIEDFGPAPGVVLRNLHVHDVNGSLSKSEGGGAGIHIHNGGDVVPSRFEGLLIEDCRVERTDRSGITTSGYSRRDRWYPNLQFVVRRNILEDIGGDGIVVTCSDGVLVERNVLRGGRRRCSDYAAGMWPWSCDHAIFQHNEVSGMVGALDGQAYDSDWNCRDILFQYNYSHDNDGGFMLVCDKGETPMPFNIGNHGTIVRYNISVNDGSCTQDKHGAVIHLGGPVRHAHFYNNTIYLDKNHDALLHFGSWGGWSLGTRFTNNLLLVEGSLRFDPGAATQTQFSHNAFIGACACAAEDAAAVLEDPRLLRQVTGQGAPGINGLRLQPGSSCIGRGLVVEDAGGRDYWGNPVPQWGPVDIGCHQLGHATGIVKHPRSPEWTRA